jgi:peptidoglycan/LPS O-acetylase OafA/YrhL
MYLKQLTFTRFLAALWVVLFHSGNIFTNLSVIGFVSKGSLGVSYFFVLSGFVMMLAYYNPNKPFFTKVFYLNRIARIYPLYLFATLLSIILKYFLFSKAFTFSDNLVNILVLQAFFFPFSSTIPEVFGLGWSLTTEFVFYALFPVLLQKIYLNIQITAKKIFFITCIVWILSVGISSILQNLNTDNNLRFHDFIFHFPLWHINQFLIGNFFGLLFIQFKDKNLNFPIEKYSDILLLVLFGSLLVALKILPFWTNKYSFFPYVINVHNGVLAYLFGAIMLVLSFNKGVVRWLFSQPLLILLGEISYAIYLLQEVVMYIWEWIVRQSGLSLTPQLSFFYYLLFLLLFSYAAHKSIEKPCLKLLKKFY